MNLRAWLLILFLAVNPAYAEVIASNTVKNPKIDDILVVFEGRTKSWRDGTPMIIYALPRESIATKNFAWRVLKISPHSFEDRLNNLRATSQGNTVRNVDTESQMFRSVSLTIGAVGYIDNALLLNSGSGLVKVIPVD